MFIKDNIEQKNLQYKMFLLNDVFVNATRLSQRFTIQNVPIKYNPFGIDYPCFINLQYKMFLLNQYKEYCYLFFENDLQYKMFLLNLIFLKLPI